MTFVAVVAEVLDDVLGPLVGFGQKHAVGVFLVHRLSQQLEDVVGLGKVLAVGAVALDQIRHGVEPEPVKTEVEPEAKHVEHRFDHFRIVVVQVRLMGEEAMPVVRLGLLVPGPVRRLRVGEDDPRVFIAVDRVRPHVPVTLG